MRAVLLMCGLLSAAGCVQHVRPYKPKVRDYKPEKYAPVVDRRVDGSLWNETADTLFTYRRASLVGDLITVVVSESANATRGAGTSLSRSSNFEVGIGSLAGLMKAIATAHPSVDPSKLISALTKSEFEGKGTTQRSGTLQATLTARIKRVLPNGDLYVEGSKVVLVNNEESHLYISGVVRPADVEADNTVSSASIADAQVEYTGRGQVADQQRKGWFARLLDWVNPF